MDYSKLKGVKARKGKAKLAQALVLVLFPEVAPAAKQDEERSKASAHSAAATTDAPHSRASKAKPTEPHLFPSTSSPSPHQPQEEEEVEESGGGDWEAESGEPSAGREEEAAEEAESEPGPAALHPQVESGGGKTWEAGNGGPREFQQAAPSPDEAPSDGGSPTAPPSAHPRHTAKRSRAEKEALMEEADALLLPEAVEAAERVGLREKRRCYPASDDVSDSAARRHEELMAILRQGFSQAEERMRIVQSEVELGRVDGLLGNSALREGQLGLREGLKELWDGQKALLSAADDRTRLQDIARKKWGDLVKVYQKAGEEQKAWQEELAKLPHFVEWAGKAERGDKAKRRTHLNNRRSALRDCAHFMVRRRLGALPGWWPTRERAGVVQPQPPFPCPSFVAAKARLWFPDFQAQKEARKRAEDEMTKGPPSQAPDTDAPADAPNYPPTSPAPVPSNALKRPRPNTSTSTHH